MVSQGRHTRGEGTDPVDVCRCKMLCIRVRLLRAHLGITVFYPMVARSLIVAHITINMTLSNNFFDIFGNNSVNFCPH